jgi:hypothetical protein
MNRIETHKMYDRWPILPDLDRVRPWLDDDQRKALDDVVDIYAVERERAGSLLAIVGANTSEVDPSDQWHGPHATAARAEDERRAETAIRNGKPVPDPTAVPALRATVTRLAAQRRPVVTVANDLLAVLEQTLTAGRDALIGRVDAAIDEAIRAGADVDDLLDLADVLGWAIDMPDRLDIRPTASREREAVRRARATIAGAPGEAIARVRERLTAGEEVPA